jgi:hypothetical protein
MNVQARRTHSQPTMLADLTHEKVFLSISLRAQLRAYQYNDI